MNQQQQAVAYAVPVSGAQQGGVAYAQQMPPQGGVAMATAVPASAVPMQQGFPGQQQQVIYGGGFPQQGMVQQGALMGAVPQQSMGVCRSCGRQFQRQPGASQFSDQWFRCQNCAGVQGADFCCAIQ